MQGHSESLQVFVALKLIRLAYKQVREHFLHQIIINSFIGGVKDMELEQTIRLGLQKVLKEALIYGLGFEAQRKLSENSGTLTVSLNMNVHCMKQ